MMRKALYHVKWYTPEKGLKYPTSFKVDFVGQPYKDACYYRITRCPICTYCKKSGLEELIPLFCELDSVMITLQHGVLTKKHTIAEDYAKSAHKRQLTTPVWNAIIHLIKSIKWR